MGSACTNNQTRRHRAFILIFLQTCHQISVLNIDLYICIWSPWVWFKNSTKRYANTSHHWLIKKTFIGCLRVRIGAWQACQSHTPIFYWCLDLWTCSFTKIKWKSLQLYSTLQANTGWNYLKAEEVKRCLLSDCAEQNSTKTKRNFTTSSLCYPTRNPLIPSPTV